MIEPAAKLIIGNGPQAGQEIDLRHDVTTLGRATTCQVFVDDEFASRRHAQIIRRDELYWLNDLNSKNGTLLDGQPVTAECRLYDGAEIRIGQAHFRFYDLDATRTHPALSAEPLAQGSPPQLRLSEAAREVWLQGSKLDPPLSPKQFDLLRFLWQRHGEAVSKDEIAAAVWPEADTEAIYDYQIDKMISRLRERLGKDLIETVWGFGYKLVS
jgi:hypothetical protein